MRALRLLSNRVAVSLWLMILLSSCSSVPTKYVQAPLVMPVELTDKVVVDSYSGKTDVDLAEYTLYLLGLVEGFNEDRVSVQLIIENHNKGTTQVKSK
ncbi:hypothetical protein BN109_054 [Yersinia phage phi80-18]|uniref:Uncharacterized protein n=1 Tax=Yersinia phage phi80-18 TaxID=1206559 RepID=A0A1L0B9T5_9CAUD|nr:hypothetical protein BN109_054 [Yersinia phage phi80-18]SGZ41915.1 hypothetical protein BN109_054 [Yersinia phage phi80-18]